MKLRNAALGAFTAISVVAGSLVAQPAMAQYHGGGGIHGGASYHSGVGYHGGSYRYAGGYYGGPHGYWGGHYGYWGGRGYWGGFGLGVFVGGVGYWGPGWGGWGYGPWYGYSSLDYPYYAPAVIATQTYDPVYVQQGDSVTGSAPAGDNYWYRCDNPSGYYPYLQSCPAGWQRVAPQPSAPGH